MKPGPFTKVKSFLAVLLFILPIYGFTQDTIQLKRIGITTSPLSLGKAMKGPNFNLGVDYHLKPNLVIYLEAGIHRPFMGEIFPNLWIGIKGYYVKQESRLLTHQVQQKRALLNHYLGAELMFGKQRYTREDSIVDFGDTSNYALKYFNERTYGSLVVNQWLQWVFRSNIEISINLGVGLRINDVENDISEIESRHRDLGDWTVPAHYIQKKDLSYSLKLNFGFRIGYRI